MEYEDDSYPILFAFNIFVKKITFQVPVAEKSTRNVKFVYAQAHCKCPFAKLFVNWIIYNHNLIIVFLFHSFVGLTVSLFMSFIPPHCLFLDDRGLVGTQCVEFRLLILLLFQEILDEEERRISIMATKAVEMKTPVKHFRKFFPF